MTDSVRRISKWSVDSSMQRGNLQSLRRADEVVEESKAQFIEGSYSISRDSLLPVTPVNNFQPSCLLDQRRQMKAEGKSRAKTSRQRK